MSTLWETFPVQLHLNVLERYDNKRTLFKVEPTEKVKEEPEWYVGSNQALPYPADDVLEASIPFDSNMFSAPTNEATKVAEILEWDESYG